MQTGKLLAVLVVVATTACREADLAPLRAELVSSAELVCAAPPVRPPHVPKTRDVQPAELEAAIVKLCEQETAHLEPAPELLAVVHEGLAQDRAITGSLRRSRMMIDAVRVDLGAIPGRPEGVRTAEEALASATTRCTASWPGLDRLLLATATSRSKSGHGAEALERCADVVALARDEDLTGNMTDLLLANGQIQRAVTTCTPILDAAPKDAAARFATSLATIRSTFPSSLDDVIRRDRAEMILFSFGKGRDPSRPLPCERARALAAASDAKPLTRGDRLDLERAWKEARAESVTPDATYNEAYTLTLRVLDQLIEHAKTR